MQLGFVSAILPELSLEEVLAFAAETGFDCVEVMCWPQGKAERRYAGVTHIDVAGFDQTAAHEIQALVATYGVQISGLGYYPNPLVADPADAKRAPSNVVEGQFSVYFAAAAAARSGSYTWSAYERLDDPEIARLMQRTNVELVDGMGAGMETSVSVRASDGRRFERFVQRPKGEPENPMSWEEMRAKFTEWSERAIGPSRTAQVIDQVSSLERLDSMRELTANLGG